jgi:ammonium transporter Rh
MFGAFFGLACVYVLGKPKSTVNFGGGAHAYAHAHAHGVSPDLFSLIGTIFLWIYWPSFNGGILVTNSPQQQRAVINTIISLSGSVIAAFFGSHFFSGVGKFRPVDIQNATLAGGAAIGAVCHLTLSPGTPLLIGTCSGFVSAWGFARIAPIMESYGIYDNCGIVNLHCIPSLIGAASACVIAAYKIHHDYAVYTDDITFWDQFYGALITIAFSICTGGITGIVMKRFPDEIAEYHDEPYWEVEEEHDSALEKDKVLAHTTPFSDVEHGKETHNHVA